jgi:rhamnose transport system permease protein
MRREWSVAAAIAVLATFVALAAPSYFSVENIRDLCLVNLPVLIVTIGTTLVIITREIDISVGSVFALCSVLAGVGAKAGMPPSIAGLMACATGALAGALNGALVAYVHIPSIVVTLATMVGFRDGLRWATEGRWVENLPAGFQWLGLTQQAFPVAIGLGVAAMVVVVAWGMRHLTAGRAVYATGSNLEAARLAGVNTSRVKLLVFAAAGALTGMAALVNSARFNQIPSNTGLGLEMKVIAASVVGGAAVTGGRGTLTGTVLGVALLGMIGPALTFLQVSAQWERALQGFIILTAVVIDSARFNRAGRPVPTLQAGV